MVEKTMVSPRLTCNNLKKSYGTVEVLKGIDLEVGPGETVALMGVSGCGKSTTLKCLNFIEWPSGGDAALDMQKYMEDGKPRYSLRQIRKQIGLVFQEYNLFPNLTVERNLTLALEKSLSKEAKEAKDLAAVLAERLKIHPLLNMYPETLSGGQAQRVALARAVLLEPSVLMLDEITAALDPITTQDVVHAIEDIRSLESRQDLSIVLVTHLLPFAVHFADRIAFLHEGTILEILPSTMFINECSHKETREFVKKAMWA